MGTPAEIPEYNVGEDPPSETEATADFPGETAPGTEIVNTATETVQGNAHGNGGSMRIGVYYSPKFLEHRAPPMRDHPECPERLTVCVEALKADAELSSVVDWVSPPSVAEGTEWRKTVLKAVKRVHQDPEYLEKVRRVSESDGGGLDADTYVAPGSYEIALLAAGAWLEAVNRTLATGMPSLALARPPGHHATPDTGMGFCLLSNAAIAAKYALRLDGVARVGILDYDVHHGNGTEACVRDEPRIRFVSSHEYPLYPMSGAEGRSGEHGTILNINLAYGASFEDYMPRYRNEMLPHIIGDEPPDLVIVSAGYDALDDDPLASLEFNPEDYKQFIRALVSALGHTKIVLGLEGGYSLESNGISAGVCETLRGFYP